MAKHNAVFLCYGKIPVEEITNYEYVILEASHYSASEIAILKQHNQFLLAYISLGEFNKYTSFYDKAKNHKLPGMNKNWNSFYLDLSKQTLHEVLLEDVKEKILMKGFHGLFLDNIDNYCSFGEQKKQQHYLISLLQSIRKKFPTIHLMQNAGSEILDITNKLINSVAFESVITNYNFAKGIYRLRNEENYKEKTSYLKTIQEKYTLPFIIIEYAERKKDARKIVRKLKKYDWHLFIGQIDLQNKPFFK
ncbi:endo alpha-1,4 polygalactosaminidase [Tenacibaculum sediminilitoris]|uniref:endo alpha-1,4 polygalactosaminidase n=1 Tax=Tenacibaculum sediminilitoris TaxID=1820334 RepID=UPI0038B42D1F